jgi:cytochrome P450
MHSFALLIRHFANDYAQYEVLRLYGPVPSMAKQTESPQTLHIRGKDYTIPENYHLTLNLYSIHLSTHHWGPDAESWKPQRFVSKDNELVVPAAANTFIPWVNGPRVCPGKKFAQVEFVATMAMCLRKHRVAAVPQARESEEEVRRRVLSVAQDSEMGVNPVVKMIHPETVKLKWVAA